MATSSIFYKFKNSRADRSLVTKDWKKINFDGAVLSVLDLKRAVVEQNDLRESKQNFDLLLTNSQTGENYREEGYLVPRHSMLHVSRIPSTKEVSAKIREPPTTVDSTDTDGEKTEPLYGGGRVIPKDSTSKEDQQMMDVVTSNASTTPAMHVAGVPNPRDELFKQANLTQFNNHNRFDPSTKPPPGYVCHRCRQPGHYIRFCPTNGDPDYNFRRPKPPTGIPRSFLKPVEAPTNGDKDNQKPTLVLPDHTYAIAMPNQRQFARSLASSGSTVPLTQNPEDIVGQPLPPRPTEKMRPELYCSLCNFPFIDAVVTNCCNSTFCDPCIRRILTSVDSPKCPTCRSYDCDPTKLTPNVNFQQAVDEFLEANPAQRRSKEERLNGVVPNSGTDPGNNDPTQAVLGVPNPAAPPFRKREVNPKNTCFRCGNRGHYAADCNNALNPNAYNPLRGRFHSDGFYERRNVEPDVMHPHELDKRARDTDRDLERRLDEVDRRERERRLADDIPLVPPDMDPYLMDVRDLDALAAQSGEFFERGSRPRHAEYDSHRKSYRSRSPDREHGEDRHGGHHSSERSHRHSERDRHSSNRSGEKGSSDRRSHSSSHSGSYSASHSGSHSSSHSGSYPSSRHNSSHHHPNSSSRSSHQTYH